jgi:ribose transport system substrate-binding protein
MFETKARACAVLSAAVILLAACSSGATTAPASVAPASVAPASVAPASGAPAAGASSAACPSKPLVVGIVTFSASDTATNYVTAGAQEQATAKGWSSSIVDANGSVDQANSAIQNLVEKGVDAIVVTIFPSDSLAAGLTAARAKGIPVFSDGGGLADGVLANVDIVFGKVNADRLVKDMGGKGSLLALTYRGGRPARLREADLDATLANYPDIKVTKTEIKIPGGAETSATGTTAWLAAHPAGNETLAIWTTYDDSAIGAISSLKAANRPDVKLVYGFNGTPDAMAAIQDGWLTGTTWIDLHSVGVQLIDLVDQARCQGSAWVPVSQDGKYIFVDKTNIDQFLKDHPETAPKK